MLANLITLGRVVLLFAMVPLLYDEGLWPKVLAFVAVLFVIYMDALDGQIARKYNQQSELGGVLDVTGDRIVENVLWICFAHLHWVSVLVPIIVITRGFITDSVRSIALARGMTAFGEKTMMKFRWSRLLVASRISRGAYGAMKTAAFAYIIFLVGLRVYWGLDTTADFEARPVGWWLWWSKDLLVSLTVALCVVRGVPVVIEGRRLFAMKPAAQETVPSGSGSGC